MTFKEISKMASARTLDRAKTIMLSGNISENDAEILALLVSEYIEILELYKLYKGQTVIIPRERELREEIKEYCTNLENAMVSKEEVKIAYKNKHKSK